MNIVAAFEYMTHYITTYSNQGGWKQYHKDTWLADILYGLGVSINKDEYSFASGFDKFMLTEIKPLIDDIESRGSRHDKWEDDSIQFPRLLCEIMATQENLDFDLLCDSMDLENDRIHELLDRANTAWEKAKETL